MERETIGEGKTVEEAIDAALEELGVQQDAVEYEIVEEAGRGLFGGARGAKVRVWLKEDAVREIESLSEEPDEIEEDDGPPMEVPGGPEPSELTDEEIDRVADEAAGVLRSIVGSFGIEAEIEEYEGDYGELILDISGSDVAVLIGRHGRTLDALQVLTSSIAFRKTGLRHPMLVDVAGYRYRRKSKLDEMARRAAERVKRTGQPVEMRPMTSYERKVIHMALRDDPRVVTASEGEEPNRQVVVTPR